MWANDHFSVMFKTISGGSSTTESSLRAKLDLCVEIKKFYEKETNVKLVFKLLSN